MSKPSGLRSSGGAAQVAFAVSAVLTVWLAFQSAAAQIPAAPVVEAQPAQALQNVRCASLLYKSPISGRYEPVPLEHTDVSVDIRGLVAAATVTQRYVNKTNEVIEAVYVFPLPHDAAVYDMEMRIGQRRIRSVIREREEARKVYEAAKAEGKRAALVEQERPNIFTAAVANIMPGDKIEVELRYVEPLRWEDGRVRLTVPTVVGPRYIPGAQPAGHSGAGWSLDTDAVPDASRITPPVHHPESVARHDLSVAVQLDTGFETAQITSPSHSIVLHPQKNGGNLVGLADGVTLPNRDFVLELRQAASAEPKTALFLSSANETGESHFLLAAFPPTVYRSERPPVEMLYLIDVSGSMEGPSITQAREALLQALDRLRPDDRFGIISFSTGFTEFRREPLAATAENLNLARAFVRALRAGGGTEMLPALKQVMAFPHAGSHLRHIVVLTDGDLGNEEQIFAALRSHLGGARLFTVAIGSAPNHFLATKMAQFGRGSFTHIADAGEIREQMGQLLNRIESPVLTDVKLNFEGVDAGDIYPERVPDLFLRQPVVIYGRILRGRAGRVRLAAQAGNGGEYRHDISFDTSTAAFHPGITTLWARSKIEDATDNWRHADENLRAAIRNVIIADAIRYRLVTQFTSLVAVEEVVVNTDGGSRTVAVPTELPAGWQMQAVFGAPATGTADEFLEALGVVLLAASVSLWCWVRRK